MSFDLNKNIKQGDKGDHVTRIQWFLRDEEFYMGEIDGDFGPKMLKAVKLYQQSEKIPASGEIGNWNLKRMMEDGLYFLGGRKRMSLAPTDETPETKDRVPVAKYGDSYPPRPPFSPLTSNSQRARVFGSYDYSHRPVSGNPEAIRIHGDWESKNIVLIDLPQLARATNGKYTRVRCHAKTEAPLKSLWADWEREDLLRHIISYEGMFVPRFIRGSRSTLSNHAFGSAFDLNYYWNKLGRVPAYVGSKGCLRQLVPLAHKWGFYWGGHFNRRDGMHFEQALILKPGEYLDINYTNATYNRIKP